MAQLVCIFIFTRITYHSLRPLRQSSIIALLIGGIIIGPSLLTANNSYTAVIFPSAGRLTLDTFAAFGIMLHLFVSGVQIHVGMLKNPGKKAIVLALTGFFIPFALGGAAYKVTQRITPVNARLGIGIPLLIAVNSMTSFAVTTAILTDLNILNSELGRLAASISMISDTLGWFLAAIMRNIEVAQHYKNSKPAFMVLSIVAYYSAMLLILRPLVLRIVRHTPEGKPMGDSQIVTILAIVLGVGLCGEFVGQHAHFGVFIFGVFLPDGPPLGSALVKKLDTIATGILLPIFCAMSGLRTNVHSLVDLKTSLIAEVIILVGYMGKFTGTLLPSLCFKIPISDAVSLALLMSCKGIIDLNIYCLWLDIEVADQQLFTLLVLTMVVMTGIATPLASYLYDPSKRYKAYQGRTIYRISNRDLHLRMLVCIHNEHNVSPMINLVEASNPTRINPITIHVLQLMELTGRSTAILVPHHQKNKPSKDMTHSEHIVNAFKHVEKHSHGNVMVQHFTAISPYASMHDDICNLAIDKKISIIILPFHKHWAIDGTIETSFHFIKSVNENVLNNAPCSVGVLVDRSPIGGNQSLLSYDSTYRIAILYLSGGDDVEALAYSRRMVEHPNIILTVVWIEQPGCRLDIGIMNDFTASVGNNKRVTYKKEMVKDGEGTVQVVASMEDDIDLFIVGKHHEPNSPATLGLAEWRQNKFSELGIIGDMLAISDYTFSVLVVQQPLGADFVDSPKGSHGYKK